MKPAVKIKLDGKPFTLRQDPPAIKALVTHLDKAPADEVFTPAGLAQRSGMHIRTINGYSTNPLLASYTTKNGALRYFGNPKAIVALREQIEAAQ
jgi:hypothetical protein